MNRTETSSATHTNVTHRILSSILALACLLCMAIPLTTHRVFAYTPRLSAPYNDYHYTTGNQYYKDGYGMPNCTCYAWGRAYEILGHKPNLPIANAGEWYSKNKSSHAYPYGRAPRLGAIACWGRHVAVVEQINGSSITISESHYSGRYFDTHKLTYGSESSYAGTFYGYIYILDNAGEAIASEVLSHFNSGNRDTSKDTTGNYTTDTNGHNLNLRSGPGTGNGVIGQIPANTKVYVSDIQNGWGKVSYGGTIGWIAMQWLKKA